MWFRRERSGARGEPLPEQNDGPPDSERLSGQCPRCDTHSSFEYLNSLPVGFDGSSIVDRDGQRTRVHHERVTSLICRHCGQGVAVVEEMLIGGQRRREYRGGGQVSWRGVHWWPLAGTVVDEAVPKEIASVFTEACQVIAANCPRAGAVMARRTLEAITVDKGHKSGNLAARLKAMSESGILHPTLADWAKEVRLIGNAGAHYDPAESVEIEDAEQLRDFLRELLKFLYVLPAELEKRRRPGKP
jgi:hypothetical protein